MILQLAVASYTKSIKLFTLWPIMILDNNAQCRLSNGNNE